jgi:hypothetical protein
MKSKKIKLFIISVIIILIAILSILILKKQQELKDKPISYLPTSLPTNNVDDAKKILYQSIDGKYSYEYPNIWTFIKNREGSGLIPVEICNIRCNQEILTINSNLASKSDTDIKAIHIAQFGIGYSNLEDLDVNGSKAIYTEYPQGIIAYTIMKGNLIIQVSFIEEQNDINGVFDYRKYIPDVKKIVESIKIN